MASEIMVRDDLSFTERDEVGRLRNWLPGNHGQEAMHDAGLAEGKHRFTEIEQLASNDEFEAYQAIRFALVDRAWDGNWGEESAFADMVARFAVMGMWALREGQIGKVFDPDLHREFSLEMKLHRANEEIGRLEILVQSQ